MPYLGNTPEQQAFTPAVDYFSGNGSTTAFTLSRPVASVAQVQVTVENVPQVPGTAYTVSGNTITFDGAPPSGTNNIYVYYTSPITQVIQPGQGTVNNQQLDICNLNGTGAAYIPSGTTAQRPSSPIQGYTRYNATTGTIEFYNGTNWIPTNLVPTINSVTGNIYAGAASNLSLSLTNATNTVTVRFSEAGVVLADVSGVSVSGAGAATVAVPSAVFSQSAGDSISISILNSDNTASSNSVSLTVLGLPTGGTITTTGSFRVHTFTTSGTFSVPTGVTLTNVEYLVVAGGGGNAARQGLNRESGSGAGGYRCSVVGESSGGGASAEARITVPAGSYSVTVGAGGSGQSNGANSSFNTITSIGGGYGGNEDGSTYGTGASGGSGGGAWYFNSPGSGTSGQGYAGSASGGSNNWTGGGGGGAGSAGFVSGDTSFGGSGVSSSITGTAVTRASGGRGNRYAGTVYNTSGAANTGDGASGIGNGGSGIVVVRYQLS